MQHIRQAILRTARLPYAARIGRVEGTREIVIPNLPYLVAIRIVENSVHVLAVFHGAREWPKSFE